MRRIMLALGSLGLVLFACGEDAGTDAMGTTPPAQSAVNPSPKLKPLYRLPKLGDLLGNGQDFPDDVIDTWDISLDRAGILHWYVRILRRPPTSSQIDTYWFTVAVDPAKSAVVEPPERPTTMSGELTFFNQGTGTLTTRLTGSNEWWYVDGSHGSTAGSDELTIDAHRQTRTLKAISFGPDDKVTGEYERKFDTYEPDEDTVDPKRLRLTDGMIPIDNAGHMGVVYANHDVVTVESLDKTLAVEAPYTVFAEGQVQYVFSAKESADRNRVAIAMQSNGQSPISVTTLVFDKTAKTLTKVLSDVKLPGASAFEIDVDADGDLIFTAKPTEGIDKYDLRKVTPAGETTLVPDFHHHGTHRVRSYDGRVFLAVAWELFEVLP